MKKNSLGKMDSFDCILPDYGRRKLLTYADSIKELADTFRETEQGEIKGNTARTEDRKDYLWKRKIAENNPNAHKIINITLNALLLCLRNASNFSGKKHFIFSTKEFRLSTKKQKLSQDFSAPSIEICRIPLKDGRIEFCFYSYKLRKHLWRKFIAPEPGKKEKWNWYYINTVQIPSAAEKIEFAVHSDWFVMPTPVFSKLRKENSHTGSWKIFARMKFEGERVLLDSIAFSAEKNQCSEKN